MKKRIPLGPDYHAEPGETKGHQHDVYTTKGELHGYTRIHVGTLMKSAVKDLAEALAAQDDDPVSHDSTCVPPDLKGFHRLGWIAGRHGPSLPNGIAQELINLAAEWDRQEAYLPTEDDITQAMIQAGRHAANLSDGTLADIYLAMRRASPNPHLGHPAGEEEQDDEQLETRTEAEGALAGPERRSRRAGQTDRARRGRAGHGAVKAAGDERP